MTTGGPTGGPAGVRRAPSMVDLRLLPAGVCVWSAGLLTTGGFLGVGTSRAAAAVAALAALLLAVWWRVGTRSRPRGGAHALTPSGSLRLAGVVCATSLACALLVGSQALLSHGRDPAVRLVAAGTTSVSVEAELTSDPAPMSSRWAQGPHVVELRLHSVAPAWEPPTSVASPSSVRMLAQGKGWQGLARGDVVALRARVDAGFRAEAPWAGTLRGDDPELLLRPDGWRGWVRGLRAELVRVSAGLEAQGRALVPGMAIGDDRLLEDDLREDMLTSSLTHLTAVSGSHVAIMLGVVVAVAPGRGAWRAGAALVTMAVLVAVVGPEPSVVRSVSTAGVGVVGLLVRRPGQAQSALCAVVVVVLLVDPWSARSFGFALSVLATWGVVGPAVSWQRRMEGVVEARSRWGRVLGRFAPVVVVPVAAQVMVAPVLVLLNPWLPLWGAVANVAAAPAVAPASLLGIAAAAVAWWWPEGATWLCQASSLFTGWIAGVASAVADWPGARMPWPGGVGGALALTALVALVAALVHLGRRRRGSLPDVDDPPTDVATTGEGGHPTPGARGAWETVLRPTHGAGELG
ncbi:MAG: ComEC/Rec2 family competence protein [Pauljensenia sp.]